jgi:FkbM family methyltransferase
MNNEAGIVVFGSAFLAQQAVKFLKGSNIPVVAMLDDFTDRTEVEGVPVLRSVDFPPEKRSTLRVLVTVDQPGEPLRHTMKLLESEKWHSVELYYNYHWRELPPWLWMGRPEAHVGREAEIAQAESIWDDDASRELYNACVKAHAQRDISVLPLGTPYKRLKKPAHYATSLASWSYHEIYSYFCDQEVGRWPEPLRFLECGAYDGSDLAAAEAAGYTVEAYAGLEPNPANYATLTKVVRNVLGAQAFPLAVSERTEQLSFLMDGITGGVGRGGAVVQAISIDDAFFNFRPSLITMDVEGSEASVLRGARETIRAHRPGLAVRVYHHPHDFYVLPLLVRDLTEGLGYRYHLRRFLNSMMDMTFYALPN